MFQVEFLFSYNEKHWNIEIQKFSLIDKTIVPYLEKVKKDLQLPNDHRDHGEVPKNMKQLLKPLELATNSTINMIKKMNLVITFPQ